MMSNLLWAANRGSGGGICVPTSFFLPFLLIVISCFTPLSSQSVWQEIDDRDLPSVGDRRVTPKFAGFFSVDIAELQSFLADVPHENDRPAEASNSILELPDPTGKVESFRIVAYDIAERGSLEAFPQIRTWYGINVNDAKQTIFLDWTHRGFHASVRYGDEQAYFFDPLFRNNRTLYQAYFKSDFIEAIPFECTAGTDAISINNDDLEERDGDCNLRQYRVAIAATGEYSNYHGATEPGDEALVQSAIVTTLNRLNQVMSRELSLRLLLVEENPSVYYYDVDTDPYTGTSAGTLLLENTNNLNDELGEDTYDLGHVFSAGFNSGVAYLRSICAQNKGGGVTGRVNPEGDPFDVDYVAHEMGHQLGANHTQNNSCNYSSTTGMEPGSASTIMGYAGICAPNVQVNSNDYYHGISIQEINNHTQQGAGNNCATIISSALLIPTIDPLLDKTIPAGTPFKLEGTANNEGATSYCWEQWDPEQGQMPPRSTNEFGPLFRSFPPTVDSFRYFPELPAVVSNTDPTWEEIPIVAREMEFRLTVRNFSAQYGCVADENMNITVNDENGPFAVTDPIDGTQYSAGQAIQVQWDVASTDISPISSDSVEILYSYDGGLNFVMLDDSVANTGFAVVQLLDSLTTQGKIMVRSKNNVFYNLNSGSFSVVEPIGSPTVSIALVGDATRSDCFTETGSTTFSFTTTSSGGAGEMLEFEVSNLPEGATASFYPNPLLPGGSTTLTLNNLNAIASGIYSIAVTGNSNEAAVFTQVQVEKTGGEQLSGPEMILPPADAEGLDLQPTMAIAGNGADSYQFEVATDIIFSNVILEQFSESAIFPVESYLEGDQTYYWRARSQSGSCGFSEWSVRAFTTGDCYIYYTHDEPVVISDGPPPNINIMEINVPDQGTVTDVDISYMDIDHSWVSDLRVALIAPSGSRTTVFDRHCGSADNILLNLNQQSNLTTLPCPPNSDGRFIRPPSGNLSIFNDQAGQGTWELEVSDGFRRDGGRMNDVAIKICFTNFAPLPVELIEFTALPLNNQIQLDWETVAEEDNSGFYVERSSASSPDWEELGFVPATGRTSGRYAFTDQTVRAGIDYYYRLRQVDVDGRVEYSSIRSAQLNRRASSISLAPNPTNGLINYSWLVENDEAVDYEIYDLRGVKVTSGEFQPRGGQLDLRSLAIGVYLLKIQSEYAVETMRIVKK